MSQLLCDLLLVGHNNFSDKYKMGKKYILVLAMNSFQVYCHNRDAVEWT